jgi:hypothetical protein
MLRQEKCYVQVKCVLERNKPDVFQISNDGG